MKYHRCLLFVFFLNLLGCSTISYEEPTSGELSRVRFVTDTDYAIFVNHYDDDQCNGEKEWMRLRKGYLLNAEPKTLNIPLGRYHENAFKEFYVSANEEHYFMFSGIQALGDTYFKCGVPMGVEFLENTDYELYYEQFTSQCSVTVYQVESGESSDQAKRVKLKTITNDGRSTSDACVENFNKFRLF